MTVCPICNSTTIVKKNELFDDRYAYPGKFNLLECSKCHHKFLEAHFSAEQLSELYSDYYPRSAFDIENFKPHQEAHGFFVWFNGNKASTFRWVPKNVKVLDIGCGFGESLAYHKSRGCEVWGVEADNNIVRVAAKFGFNVKVGLFDSKDYKQDFFDYVTMDQVIEHMVDPIEALKGVAKILKPGGYVVLSTPNANGWGARLFKRYWINWHVPYHLQFFSTASIMLMAEQVDLEVQKIQTITNSRWLNYQWIHSLYFPKAGEKSIFWSYQSSKPAWTTKVIFKLFAVLHRTGIDHLLTRLFDSIGRGDNYVIVLHKKEQAS